MMLRSMCGRLPLVKRMDRGLYLCSITTQDTLEKLLIRAARMGKG